MIDQMGNEKLDAIFISVGGGGLMSGIATYVKKVNPKCKIYGCQPENSAVMYYSVKAGKLLFDVEEKPTLSDATAGAVEDGSLTFEPCRQLVDEWIIVNEEEIKDAIKLVLQKVCIELDWLIFSKEHYVIEGSAAVSVAACLKVMKSLKDKNLAVLLCGRNISYSTLQQIIQSN